MLRGTMTPLLALAVVLSLACSPAVPDNAGKGPQAQQSDDTGSDGGDSDDGGSDDGGSDDGGSDDGGSDDTGGTTDQDGDGVPASEDCDDADAGNFPGNLELCDGVDNDCSGAPEVDGDGVCGIWTLGVGETVWTAHSLNPSGTVHAPTAAIQVSFSVGTNRAWALTANSYHVLAADSKEWIASGDRDSLFPEVAGRPLTTAFKVPLDWAAESGDASVFLTERDQAYVYSWDAASGDFQHASTATFGEDWDPDSAPVTGALEAAWLANDTGVGWATPSSPRDTCGANADTLGAYLGMLTIDGMVYLFDLGYCLDFTADMPAASFSLFTMTGAPDPAVVSGISWTGTQLMVFASGAR
jgi:hypothetical protein